jgi:hypothetical protein
LLTHPAPIKQFIRDWLQSDRGNLTVSLAQFAGNPAYGPDALLGDFARFRFLLGMTDGEGVLPRTSSERAPKKPAPGA